MSIQLQKPHPPPNSTETWINAAETAAALHLSLRTFTYPAQQTLIRVALSTATGGIHAFTTIIGRGIILARVMYYKVPGHTFPDYVQCVRPAVPGGNAYPGAELILTPPTKPEPVLIDEGMVNSCCASINPTFRRRHLQKVFLTNRAFHSQGRSAMVCLSLFSGTQNP